MKIQIGKVLLNKTYQFVFPVMQDYGDEFSMVVSKMFKTAVGLGDLVLVKSGIKHERCLFILADTERMRGHFLAALTYLRAHESYIDDYAYDELNHGSGHMFVLRIPEKYHHAVDKFKKGQYSRMYSKEQIKRLFGIESLTHQSIIQFRINAQKILLRDSKYVVEFVDRLNEEYNSTVDPSEFKGELEQPPKHEDEIFNMHLQKFINKSMREE